MLLYNNPHDECIPLSALLPVILFPVMESSEVFPYIHKHFDKIDKNSVLSHQLFVFCVLKPNIREAGALLL